MPHLKGKIKAQLTPHWHLLKPAKTWLERTLILLKNLTMHLLRDQLKAHLKAPKPSPKPVKT